MQKVKYLILGAGPTGLTFAMQLKSRGERSFLLLEKEETAGGLCRSEIVDGSPFDIGGGHFLDVRRPKVNEFLFSFLPQTEWERFERDSRIEINKSLIHHPIEANIWEMKPGQQIAYLSSIARAGCNRGREMPEHFVDWIRWKLGDKIAQEYMLPYNRKIFAEELNELGTYWLDKLPNVSFKETILSCLTRKACGTQPGHASFYYPKKYGYGEVWLRIAGELASQVLYGQAVNSLDCEQRMITTKSGEAFQAEKIITTIPWTTYETISGMPKELGASVQKLKSSAIETRYFPENLDTQAQWIYYPEADIPYHRILVRHNFCRGSRGYWTETRKERVPLFHEKAFFSYLNEYAYPLNTLHKPAIVRELLDYCAVRQIYGLGRWGEHSHFNSDVVVERAMQLAEKLS